MLLTRDEHRSKIARNSVLIAICRQICDKMAIKNSVSNNFFYLRSSIVLTFSMAAYLVCLSRWVEPYLVASPKDSFLVLRPILYFRLNTFNTSDKKLCKTDPQLLVSFNITVTDLTILSF